MIYSSVNRFFITPSYHGRTLQESGGVLGAQVICQIEENGSSVLCPLLDSFHRSYVVGNFFEPISFSIVYIRKVTRPAILECLI